MSGPICLVVLDGWGLAAPGPGNAVDLADTPVFDRLWAAGPRTTLAASGRAVGLPDGQMGNSEVGHLNLGAGRVVLQDLVRIDEDVAFGGISRNQALLDACARGRDAALHLVGLVSDGGVHSHIRHLQALIEMARREGVERLHVHAFTDGRDVSPTSGAGFLQTVPNLATVCGRYFGMDRDRRWDRTKRAYDAMVHGIGAVTDDPVAAVRAGYERGTTDEFIEPIVVGDPAQGRVRGEDAVVFFNFRPDRCRQLFRTLLEPGFDEFDRGDAPKIEYASLTQYQEDWDYPVAFEPDRPTVTLASTLADEGASQLHVAETEKYAHVTYFFNGGEEHPYKGEDRFLVDSPRDVPTYDHKPEMSARAAADTFAEHWRDGDYRFGIINFANPDMVGHTGVIEAAVKAVETVDGCLGTVVEAVHESGGACVITADHGNCDHMLEDDGSPNTAHSLNPVPFIVTADGASLDSDGILADVAPTILALIGIEQPSEMTGRSLLAT